MRPGAKNPKMSPYANRKSIAIHRAETLSRTPILTSSKVVELEVDTSALTSPYAAHAGKPSHLRTRLFEARPRGQTSGQTAQGRGSAVIALRFPMRAQAHS